MLESSYFEFWQQICFLFLDDNFTTQLSGNGCSFANAAPMGNCQPLYPTAIEDKLSIDIVPRGAIDRNIPRWR
jgi:hypothetical protein